MANQSCYQEDHNNKPPSPQLQSQPQSQVAILMVPFPLQGHLNQLLHLSCLLTSYEISLHFAGSSTHNHQARARIQGWNPNYLTNITFHDFQLPPFTCPAPDPGSPVKFPSHLQPLFHSCSHLRDPICKLQHDLSAKFRRVVVVHDTLMASVVQDVRGIPNVESFAFQSVSAFTVFLYIWDSLKEKPFEIEPNAIPCIPSNEGCFTEEFAEFIAKEYKVLDFESGRLFNTCREVEGEYMKLLQKLPMNANKKLFAIGPVNPIQITTNNTECTRHECLTFLDNQDKHSVLYISFGTTTSLNNDQIKELAIGLERSGQKFIWVLRDADKDDIFTSEKSKSPELPQGFEERVKNRGMVVRDWAPQLAILSHVSTGGFMSHCGWNSCIEATSRGVPIATWPMHSDQPRNAILITKVLRIGLEVKSWEKREELVKSEVVENVVRRLMESQEGEEIRERAKEIGGVIRRGVESGGVSSLEVGSFVGYVTR